MKATLFRVFGRFQVNMTVLSDFGHFYPKMSKIPTFGKKP